MLLKLKSVILERLNLKKEISVNLKVQHTEMYRLVERFKRFGTVSLETVDGRIIDHDFLNSFRGGPDGGLDMIIRINARTERGMKWVETRVLNILRKRDF